MSMPGMVPMPTPSKVGGDLRWGQCCQLTYLTGKSSGPLLLFKLSMVPMFFFPLCPIVKTHNDLKFY